MSKFKIAAIVVIVLSGACAAFGQRANDIPNPAGSGRAQGSLTVTLTVASSVGLVTGSDGQPRVVMANAAAASDNVSSVRYVRLTDVNGSYESASQAARKISRQPRKITTRKK